MSAGDRLVRSFVLGPPARPRVAAPSAATPGEDAGLGARRVLPAYVLALLLPVAIGAALIWVRDDLRQAVSLIMVLPVLFVAVLGGIGPGIVCAVSASITFDLFHTQPYYRFVIDARHDVIEMIVLLVVGVLAGAFTHVLRRSVVASETRRAEVEHLRAFATAVARTHDTDALLAETKRALTALLSLRSCEWHPGYHGTASPVLQADGRLSAAIRGTDAPAVPDGDGVLPPVVELPVAAGGVELGRFILQTARVSTSVEERKTAGAVVALLASTLRT